MKFARTRGSSFNGLEFFNGGRAKIMIPTSNDVEVLVVE